MKYLKVWTSFRQTISMLSDEEKGRLFEAMLLYAECGQEIELTGNERIIWPGARQGIDLAAIKNETNKNNGMKGGRPPDGNSKKTDRNRTKPKRTETNRNEPTETEQNRTEPKNDNQDSAAGYPFGLTDADIHESLERDRQIEECARYMGLETTMAALDKAKDMAHKYGLENLLAAMRKAVDVHEWRYVEGILKKGGASAEPGQEQAPKAQAAAEAQEEVNWL